MLLLGIRAVICLVVNPGTIYHLNSGVAQFMIINNGRRENSKVSVVSFSEAVPGLLFTFQFSNGRDLTCSIFYYLNKSTYMLQKGTVK